jgi:hypothetical protein
MKNNDFVTARKAPVASWRGIGSLTMGQHATRAASPNNSMLAGNAYGRPSTPAPLSG